MDEGKYNFGKYLSFSTVIVGGLSYLVGLGTLIGGLISNDLESIVGGGFLHIGGILTLNGENSRAYMKNKLDDMNEKDRNQSKVKDEVKGGSK